MTARILAVAWMAVALLAALGALAVIGAGGEPWRWIALDVLAAAAFTMALGDWFGWIKV